MATPQQRRDAMTVAFNGGASAACDRARHRGLGTQLLTAVESEG